MIAIAVIAIGVFRAVRTVKRLGKSTVSEAIIEAGRPLLRAHRDLEGARWDALGSATEARGLDLRFSADDDPAAEATIRLPEAPEKPRASTSLVKRVTLTGDWRTEHVHTGGYVFRLRLRGAPGVVGKVVRLQMRVDGEGNPWAGRIENDDDDPAAVGDWIEIEWLEILDVREGTG